MNDFSRTQLITQIDLSLAYTDDKPELVDLQDSLYEDLKAFDIKINLASICVLLQSDDMAARTEFLNVLTDIVGSVQ